VDTNYQLNEEKSKDQKKSNSEKGTTYLTRQKSTTKEMAQIKTIIKLH
jgi:hypothetical protein